MNERDPRIDPRPGDSLEHPQTENFRKVRVVEMGRVYYVMIDAAGRRCRNSARLDTWRTEMRSATVVHVAHDAETTEAP